MKFTCWGGRAAVFALLGALMLPVPELVQAADEAIRIVVAPLEVHASADTVRPAAHKVRESLVREIDELPGIKGLASAEGDEDITEKSLTREALSKIATVSGSAFVVYGSLTQLGGTYSFDARLYDPVSGKAKAAFFREGAGLDDLIEKMADLADEIERVVVVTAPPREVEAGNTQEGQVSEDTADPSNSGGASARTRSSSPLGLRVRDNKQPIAITSDTLEAINKANTVVFRGNVEARQAGLQIYCDVMTVLYAPDGKGIIKIVADRRVRIIQKSDRQVGGSSGDITATCDRGVYYNAEGRIDLTGNPVVKRGHDTIKGNKISVYLDDSRFTVRQAKVTISPEGMQALDEADGSETAEPNEGE